MGTGALPPARRRGRHRLRHEAALRCCQRLCQRSEGIRRLLSRALSGRDQPLGLPSGC